MHRAASRVHPFCLLALLAGISGCPGKAQPDDGGARATSEAAPAASSAATIQAGPDVPVDCTAAECTVTSITDRVKDRLEKLPDYKNLKIVFGKGATNKDLKTLEKIPWVTYLRIDSEEITDTFGLDVLQDLKKLEIG